MPGGGGGGRTGRRTLGSLTAEEQTAPKQPGSTELVFGLTDPAGSTSTLKAISPEAETQHGAGDNSLQLIDYNFKRHDKRPVRAFSVPDDPDHAHVT